MIRTRSFETHPSQLRRVRVFITECARGGPFEPYLDDLLIAASEASANAVAHSGSDRFSVTWDPRPDSVCIVVEDQGIYQRRVSLPEIDGTAHRGIHLIAATMNEVTLTRGTRKRPGTTVRMVRRLAAANPTGAPRRQLTGR
jgi:anti-sigma regulatory factor (Ser/Thr protein kinase)